MKTEINRQTYRDSLGCVILGWQLYAEHNGLCVAQLYDHDPTVAEMEDFLARVIRNPMNKWNEVRNYGRD